MTSAPPLTPPWPAHEIVPRVWQAGSPEPGDPWDVIVDLDGDNPPLPDIGLYVHWRILDGPEPDRSTLVAVADFVNALRHAGKRVLVHCGGGINRSGLVCAAALIRDGMPPETAIATVRTQRPGSLDNPRFVALLQGGL